MPTINSITDTTKFKKWIETINAIISALRPATQTSEGLLSASDKKKLDSIESGASRTDIDNLTIGVNNGGTSILIEGNTGNTSNIIFKQGSGVEIASTESEENSTKNYTVTISASSYSQATGATETSNGTLGLIQATAGSPERMLFADMTWRESEDTLNADSKYPISSKAVKDALNDYAQIDHASTETIYGVGNEHEYGHVKLTDTSNNTLDASSGIAVSPKALYDVSMTAERAERQANENASVISSLQSSIVGAYRYAGSVDTYEELLQISASVGDVYNVASPLSLDGPNYAWNGMSWDNLSGILSVDTQVVEGSNNAVTSDAVYNEIIKLAPKNHASEDTRYGVSDSEHYGHVKLTDDINASYALSDGYAATPSITNKIWKYSQETRELVKESNFTVFQSADEAYIPDVYDDPDAPTTVPSKVAFAEVNSVVSEITERVENIELNYAKKSGDEFTGNVSFLAGTRKNIVSLNGADNLVIIDPSLADNFSLDCINTEYEIDISNIDASSVTFSLVVKGGENVTFVWPDNVRWSNSMEPLLSSGIDILKFYTIDGGENWYVTHELSNSNISLDVYGIITENDGYLYRITSKMMSKWKMPIGDEVVLSSASFSSGEYYILTEDDTTNVYNIYLYNNESFGLYKTLSKTDYRLKKIYSDNNNLYLIGNNSIYVVNGDSYDVIYSVENGDTNEIIDFVMYYSKPYIVVSSNDVFHVYYANETDAIDGDIEITEFSVGENKKACFSIIDNRLYLASENGTMMIDASSKALIVPIFYRFSCSDLISFNEKILCYFNNGVGIIENDENGVYINDWKYVGEKYNVSDIKEFGYEFYGCSSSSGLASYNRESYKKLRKDFNALKKKNADYYYMFYLLIVFGFNNQIRFNSKGHFNLPVGKRDFNNKMRTKLINFVNSLKERNTIFSSEDFLNLPFERLTSDDFVYADPPYLITCAAYNESGGWTEKDEVRLLQTLDLLNAKKIRFALSNVLENKGKINYLLKEWLSKNHTFKVIHLNYDYSNSNYHCKKNTKTDEVLIINY